MSKLWKVDPITAAATMIANIPQSETLVAMTFLPDNTLLVSDDQGEVFRIDPVNGQTSTIGSYGMMLATAGDLVAVADGTMYGMSDKKPGGMAASMSNVLLKVDTANGRATPIGTGIGYGKVFGMAYVNGKVYAFTDAGEIVEIDRMTGTGRLVKTFMGKQFWGAGVTPLVTIG
jgi:outer membrane protein assembly factor BamB